jgi:hypothetical protein
VLRIQLGSYVINDVCVVAQEEFLVFTNRTHIHRYVFDRNGDELVPISGPTNILAVDYDYSNDCVFWSDVRLYNIQVARNEPVLLGRLS